jgi:glutamate-ammonia-ligase adenylyltransferase
MLVSSVAAFERYQENSAWIWEHQALTRARFCAGDAAIGERFEAVRERVLRTDRTARADELKQEVLKMRKKMHDAHPPRPGLFDLKQDEGGMIDVEFMSQYLVLRHCAQYPQLTINLGNIGLLRMFADLGLIDAGLALAVGDAYRAMRKLQHQMRLQGKDNARVDAALVAKHAAPVRQLWEAVFA